MRQKKEEYKPEPGIKCRDKLSADGCIKIIREVFESVADVRQGQNIRYQFIDYLMSGYAIFFTKSPSLLKFKNFMQENPNLKNIFKIKRVPSEEGLRTNLDKIEPKILKPAFTALFHEIQRGKVLESFVSINETYLCASDGSEFFKSFKKQNKTCTIKNHSNGTTSYSLATVCSAIVHPNKKNVIVLCPEAIRNEDGTTKNDCESNAFHRQLLNIKQDHPRLKITHLLDALFGNYPIVKAIKKQGDDFIIGIKEDSHKHLYSMRNECKEITIEEIVKKEIATYNFSYKNQVSINMSHTDELVNVLFFEERIGKKVQKFAWITSHEITDENVMEIMKAGRARWKVENETFNTLKNLEYNFEHCYGIGKEHLPIILVQLMLLSFLTDQIQDECCKLFQAALLKKKQKIYIWQYLRSYIDSFIIKSVEEILHMIVYGIVKQPPMFAT